MSRVVQEKAVESNTARRIQLKLEQPVQGINALDLQATGDKDHVVIAGRNVFKMLKVEDHSFTEMMDLRVGKINLNLSCTDVVWHPSKPNILASCATNGAVVTWNLEHMRRSKQDKVLTDHTQTVNKVCFHPKEPDILFSGSNDQTVRSFDLRQPVDTACVSIFRGQDRVRYVEYDPHHYFNFASATEAGNILLWDSRRADKCLLQYTTHSGPAFGIAWHPEEKKWLATCGRDKAIKIWCWDGNSLTQQHVINTFAPVSNIKWRSQKKFHITSCSLAIDSSIYVWDIRRPFIPLAMFEEHKDVVTGLAWREDSQTFISSGKDSMLIQHVFKDGKKPEQDASPVGVGMNIYGTICQAVSRHAFKQDTTSSSYQNTRRPMKFGRPDKAPQTKDFESKILVYDTVDDKFPEIFIETAKGYKLRGLPFEQLCEHNASVAQSLSRHQVAQTWLMLKLFYSESSNTIKKPTKVTMLETTKGMCESEKDLSKATDKKMSLTNVGGLDSTTGITSDESQSDSELDPASTFPTTNHKHNHHQQGSFFYQVSDDDEEFSEIQCADGHDEFGDLPSEAFQPRHELLDRPPSPTFSRDQSRPESPISTEEAEVCNAVISKLSDSVIPSYKQNFCGLQLMARYQPIIVDMLKFYAEQGDVQMSVSTLIVLQDRIQGEIDNEMQEHWFTSYIDLLHRFKLYTCANDIIKLCKLDKVGSMNQLSTIIYTKCNRCQHDLEKCGWACSNCRHDNTNRTNTCSICHLPVKGLYVWCQGCSHGGHLSHISDWLKDNITCPTGCGHKCEYT